MLYFIYNASVSRDIVQPSLISPPQSSSSLYTAAATVGRRNVILQVNARHLPKFEILIKIEYIQFFSLLNVKKLKKNHHSGCPLQKLPSQFPLLPAQ